MAEHVTRILVEADSEEAKRQLDDIRAKAESLRRSQLGIGEDAGKAKTSGDAFGQAAGRQIAKALVGFAASQAVGVLFGALRQPGQKNDNLDRAEGTAGGAMQGASMGMMFGPWGAAIGAALGGIVGFLRKDNAIAERDAAEARAIRYSAYDRDRGGAVSASDQAFTKLLQQASGKDAREALLQARLDQIRGGTGSWSIANLQKDVDSGRATEITKENLELQKKRASALEQQILQNRMSGEYETQLDASSFSDAFSKRGLRIGAQVDMADVNGPVVNELQKHTNLLRKIAESGTDELHSVNWQLRVE